MIITYLCIINEYKHFLIVLSVFTFEDIPNTKIVLYKAIYNRNISI